MCVDIKSGNAAVAAAHLKGREVGSYLVQKAGCLSNPNQTVDS